MRLSQTVGAPRHIRAWRSIREMNKLLQAWIWRASLLTFVASFWQRNTISNGDRHVTAARSGRRLSDRVSDLARRPDAEFMRGQPRFSSAQLHRAIGKSQTHLAYAVWESTALFRAAFPRPERRSRLIRAPPRPPRISSGRWPYLASA
jgi:hypothetical protein